MDDPFQHALAVVLENEGGLQDDANDPGGATNHGISLRFLREIPPERLRKYGFFTSGDALNAHDIQELTRAQVEMIYRGEFWDIAKLDALAELEWENLSSYVFDMIVHHGIGQGIKILQRAIWSYYQKRNYAGNLDDGILGEKTILELQMVDEHHFLTVLACERAGYCRLICALNPKEKEFLDGWIDRCYRI
jgi:lysozyme family protein